MIRTKQGFRRSVDNFNGGETNRAKRWTGNTANSMKIDSRRYRSLAPRR